MNASETIAKLFFERGGFVVVGLTGRTGSGCTTAAKLLETDNLDFPELDAVKMNGKPFYKGLDAKRYLVLKKYAKENWSKFHSIKVSDLISVYLLLLDALELETFIVRHCNIEAHKLPLLKDVLTSGLFSKTQLREKFDNFISLIANRRDRLEITDSEKVEFLPFLATVRDFTANFKVELRGIDDKLYINLYQSAGNSIRRTGSVTSDYEQAPLQAEKVFTLPEAINRVIKVIRQIENRAFVVIDAIRNPYEARFFRDRYSAFYLVSINAADDDRDAYLKRDHKFTKDQLERLEKTESGKIEKEEKENADPEEEKKRLREAQFVNQNVKRCIEISDIHIVNARADVEDNNVLRAQLGWYFALMMHPGLVSPTAMERIMQIAYTAKSNSGCISRQVGAVVTDAENSIKAVGWNDVPHGQTPCSLRALNEVVGKEPDEEIYSDYERSSQEFRPKADGMFTRLIGGGVTKTGRPLSYCFKDIKNSIDSKGNQVHTRSLHAEENAFLQVSKYGGQAVKGGRLYTTASPCELCAKKAYQLEIAEVVFIDPYPGIAKEHILSVGSKRPQLVQFRGAVGKGYHQLYEPMMAYKDELDAFL